MDSLSRVPASMDRLRALHEEGLLSHDAFTEAVARASISADAGTWRTLLDRLTLFVGVALALAGVVFFFAWNWDGLGRDAKLALILGPIAASVLASAGWGAEDLRGKLGLVVGTVLFLTSQAVLGQQLQSGADAWTLFALSAAVTLPWTLVARMPAQWLIWLALATAALGFGHAQEVSQGGDDMVWSVMWAMGVPGAAWALSQLPIGRRMGLTGSWLPTVLVAVPLQAWTGIVCLSVFEFVPAGLVAGVLVALTAGVSSWRALTDVPRLADLAAVALSLLMFTTAVLSRLFFEELDGGAFAALVIGFVVVVQVGASAAVLRQIARRGAKA